VTRPELEELELMLDQLVLQHVCVRWRPSNGPRMDERPSGEDIGVLETPLELREQLEGSAHAQAAPPPSTRRLRGGSFRSTLPL